MEEGSRVDGRDTAAARGPAMWRGGSGAARATGD